MLELQEDLDQTEHARAGFQVPDIRLDRTQRATMLDAQAAVPELLGSVGQRESPYFDGVAKRRPGSMRLDVGNRPRIDGRRAQAAKDRF